MTQKIEQKIQNEIFLLHPNLLAPMGKDKKNAAVRR